MTDRAARHAPSRAGRLAWWLRQIKFRVRTLLIVVAVIALSWGGGIEVANHRQRDRGDRAMRTCLARAEWHERESAYCRAAERRGEPFDLRRAENNKESRWTAFSSWHEENAYHEEYAPLYRAEAERQRQLRDYYQSRLIWPY